MNSNQFAAAWVTLLFTASTCQFATAQDKLPTASQPAAPATQRATGRTPDQVEVLQHLLREREGRTPILPVTPERTAGRTTRTGLASEGDESGLLLEGSMVVERSGRLVRSGEAASFEFDALGPQQALATMELSKNSLLEQMENVATGGGTSFIVSGEITRYRGRNYLTLRRVSVRAGVGNLSP